MKVNKDTITVETFESTSVHNLAKIVEDRTNLEAKDMVFYFSSTLMNKSKSLSEYGIYSDKEEFYRIRLIEKVYKDKKLSIGLNPSFYKINSVRRVEWENNAPWYRESQNGLNWIAYCKNLG